MREYITFLIYNIFEEKQRIHENILFIFFALIISKRDSIKIKNKTFSVCQKKKKLNFYLQPFESFRFFHFPHFRKKKIF